VVEATLSEFVVFHSSFPPVPEHSIRVTSGEFVKIGVIIEGREWICMHALQMASTSSAPSTTAGASALVAMSKRSEARIACEIGLRSVAKRRICCLEDGAHCFTSSRAGFELSKKQKQSCWRLHVLEIIVSDSDGSWAPLAAFRVERMLLREG
jgi:hypothetical protein